MAFLKGSTAFLFVILNTIIWVPILLIFALIKLITPSKSLRLVLSQWIVGIAEIWISANSTCHRLIHGEKIEIVGFDELKKDDWYLVVSNHASTADIPVVQKVFNRKIPFLKFFLKRELIWVPLLGLAWWALDFPFMRRYSRKFIEENPHMKGKDLEVTKKACEKFKDFPISVINFVEGTRFTENKKLQQNNPYKALLNPKAGGLGFVLGSMGQQINSLLLVSIKYEPKSPSFWEYLKGSFEKVKVKVEKITIPDTIKNKNYITDSQFKQDLQVWINELWKKQDEIIEKM